VSDIETRSTLALSAVAHVSRFLTRGKLCDPFAGWLSLECPRCLADPLVSRFSFLARIVCSHIARSSTRYPRRGLTVVALYECVGVVSVERRGQVSSPHHIADRPSATCRGRRGAKLGLGCAVRSHSGPLRVLPATTPPWFSCPPAVCGDCMTQPEPTSPQGLIHPARLPRTAEKCQEEQASHRLRSSA